MRYAHCMSSSESAHSVVSFFSCSESVVMFIVRFQSALLRLLFSSFFCVLLGILCLFVLGFFFRLHRLLFYVLWWACFLVFACTRHNKCKKCAIVWQAPVVRGATSRALRALLPSCVLRRRGPHSCAAPRRPRVCRCRVPNSQTVLVALPGRTPWPNVFLACYYWRLGALPRARPSKLAPRRATLRALHASLRSCGTLAPRRGVQGWSRCVPKSQTVCPDSLPAKPALPGRPPWPNVCLAPCQRCRGPLLRARRSLHAVPHRALCAHRSGTAHATTLPALLRRAATSKDARAARPRRKLFLSLLANCCDARPPAVAQRCSLPLPAASRVAASRATL